MSYHKLRTSEQTIETANSRHHRQSIIPSVSDWHEFFFSAHPYLKPFLLVTSFWKKKDIKKDLKEHETIQHKSTFLFFLNGNHKSTLNVQNRQNIIKKKIHIDKIHNSKCTLPKNKMKNSHNLNQPHKEIKRKS